MANKKAISIDIETVPFYLDPKLCSNYRILMEEFNRLFDETKQKDPNFFCNYPQFNIIIAIGITIAELVDGQWNIVSEHPLMIKNNNEAELIQRFNVILNKGPYLYVHFNGLGFDIPLLIYKHIKHHIWPMPFDFSNLYRFKSNIHYDLKQVASNYGVFPISFRVLSTELGLDDPKSEMDGSKVKDYYLQGRIKEIMQYGQSDANANIGVLNELWRYYKV